MAVFTYIGSNSLIFTRDEELKNPQTDFNREYGDIEYSNKFFLEYRQKMQQSDNLHFQFITDYVYFTHYLVNAETGGEQTLTDTFVDELDTGEFRYNTTVDISGLDGCYYIRMEANSDYDKPIINFRSNTFEVRQEFENTLLLEWYGNSAYDDGYLWVNDTQEYRIEAELINDIGGASISTYMDDNYNTELLDYHPEYKQKLQCRYVARTTAHLLNRIIGHDIFVINGVQYTIESAFDFGDNLGRSRAYVASIEVKKKDYETYTELEQLEGELPEVPETSLAFDSTTSLAFDSTTSLSFFSNE